ncbi:MAG: hypothetical protein ABFS46_13570, partial [Myxococcota bacterium]
LARRARRYAREVREFDRSRERARSPEPRGEAFEPGASESATPEPETFEFPEVLGWQPLVLNSAQSCARCGRSLARGDRAFLGLATGGPGNTWLCRECVPS